MYINVYRKQSERRVRKIWSSNVRINTELTSMLLKSSPGVRKCLFVATEHDFIRHKVFLGQIVITPVVRP